MSAIAASEKHYPVMLPEVLEALQPKGGGVYVDGTFGAGGYTRAILDAADCHVFAIDRDVSAQVRASEFKDQYGERFTFLRGCFGDVQGLLNNVDVDQVDGFVLDIGVSSMQIDEADRGFSFRFDGPLDMRMDAKADLDAAVIVNEYTEEDLANIIYEFGEERKSRRIAKMIVEARKTKSFKTTFELADVVRAAVPRKHSDKIDPATRTFQALRIAVNDELGELDRALDASGNILRDGGRLVVVSFHSLEDRRVKRFMREASGADKSVSRHAPQVTQNDDAPFKLVSRKAVKPSDKEVAENVRSRSARLRVAERTSYEQVSGGAL